MLLLGFLVQEILGISVKLELTRKLVVKLKTSFRFLKFGEWCGDSNKTKTHLWWASLCWGIWSKESLMWTRTKSLSDSLDFGKLTKIKTLFIFIKPWKNSLIYLPFHLEFHMKLRDNCVSWKALFFRFHTRNPGAQKMNSIIKSFWFLDSDWGIRSWYSRFDTKE